MCDQVFESINYKKGKKGEKLPFLGEKRIRLLGTGAKSHPHFAGCPVDTSLFGYTTLQNWHPGEFDARRSTRKSDNNAMIIEHTAHDITSYAPNSYANFVLSLVAFIKIFRPANNRKND